MIVYREPKRSAVNDRGLIAGLMRAPTSAAVRPEENQFSEALAWVLRRVPGLARHFALLFISAGTEAEQAIISAAEIGVDTRVTARGPSGEVLYPDLSLCGSNRSFQLLVEVKVGTDFAEYELPDGSRVSQPVIYAHALEADPPEVGALLRRVGTLSREPDKAPSDRHPLRCRDVGWSEVRELIRFVQAPCDISGVVRELIEAIDARILPTPPPDDQVNALLDWSQTVLPRVLRALALRAGGTTTGTARGGQRYPYRGGYVDYPGPGGVGLRMWLYVSPSGVGYSLPGEPDAVYLQPDQEGKAGAELQGQIAHGFQWERDIAGLDAWRMWVTAEDVRAAGAVAAQEAFLIEAFCEALEAAGHLGAS